MLFAALRRITFSQTDVAFNVFQCGGLVLKKTWSRNIKKAVFYFFDHFLKDYKEYKTKNSALMSMKYFCDLHTPLNTNCIEVK